jgi:hypothetical protein
MGLPIVIVPPGAKGPRTSAWPEKRYTAPEINRRFGNSPALNVGLILGPESGAIDIEGDSDASEADFAELFAGCDVPTVPSWRSKRSLHRLFAVDPRLTALGKAVVKYKSVEIRLGAGKAAQSLLPPSVTDGHAREWVTPISVDCKPAELPEEVIERILTAATAPAAPPAPAKTEKLLDKSKPGDDFCVRGTWKEILAPHGWAFAGEADGKQTWTRPGKVEGVSATTGHCESAQGRDLFFCFSDNASPFQAGKSYSKFAAYSLLNHDDDFTAAANALADKGYGKKKRALSASAILLGLISDAELFHNPGGVAYASVAVGGHYETMAIDSRQIKRYLEYRYYKKTKGAPSAKVVTEAIGVCGARARFEGAEIPVYTRIAPLGDAIYLDLCNDKWEAIEITDAGWDVVDRPPVKFRRTNGMLPLPYPQHGASIDALRPHVNVLDTSWPLLVSGLVAALRPTGPFPIMLFNSEHGSCKSTTMRVCRQLIDPTWPICARRQATCKR